MVNGQHVENVSAPNTRSAILVYCRSNGIEVGSALAYGQCGNPIGYCSKSPLNGRRPCGNFGKCKSTYLTETSVGQITAIPTPMGGIGQ